MRALLRRSEQGPGSFEENPNFGVPRLLSPPGKSEGRITWVPLIGKQWRRTEGSRRG